jgi:hypothetical protein
MLQNRVFLTGVIALSALSSYAAPKPVTPEFKLDGSLRAGWLEVIATAPAQYHFNLKAPMVLESEKIPHRVTPAEKSRNAVSFRVPEAGVSSGLKISLYLCDDQNTFCEKRTIDAVWTPARKLVTSR